MVAQFAGSGAAIISLSSNDAIQFILADIPTFTVGILAFGTLTFSILMKRVDRWLFCLHMSVLLSFLAALLDLSQILTRGNSKRPTDVTGIIVAREVFYSFAEFLRFLFYWGFVAMIPLGETIPEGNKMHSGSWRRWGLPGTILKWSTLLLIVVMTIFQLVYRDVPSSEEAGPVYGAAAGLEIILSAVFILKLLLNTWARFSAGTATPSKGRMLVQYLPMIAALLFSMWIAVGNLILFEFTETALGRFLRAVELYIDLVYMLTISFYHLRHLSFFPVYRPAPKHLSRIDSFKRRSIEKDDLVTPVDYDQPPTTATFMQALDQFRGVPEIPQTVERNSARSAKVESASDQHQSMAARLSTWLSMARPLPRVPGDQQTAWDVDAERGPSPVVQSVARPWNVDGQEGVKSPALPQQMLEQDEQRGASPRPGSVQLPDVEERDICSSSVHEMQLYEPSDQVDDPESEKTPALNREWQDIEYSGAVRYSGVSEDRVANALERPYYSTQDESPIASDIQVVSPSEDSRRDTIEVDEDIVSPYPPSPLASAAATPVPRSRPLPPMPITRPTSFSDSPLPPTSARSSNMSLLFARQTEFDRTIEALRLLPPSHSSTMPVPPPPYSPSLSGQQAASGLSPTTSFGSPEVVSPIPEFSLATPGLDRISQGELYYEQHQPPLNRSSTDSGVMPAPTAKLQQKRQEEPCADSLQPPPRMPTSRFSDSSTVSDGRERRVDSQGTQYDITSFVGNLTNPINPKDSLQSADSATSLEHGDVKVATVTGQAVPARPTFIAQPARLPETPSQRAGSLESGAPTRRALPPIPASQAWAHSPQQPRFRRAVGLPPRPRLSIVNLTPVEEMSTPSPSDTLVTSPRSRSDTPVWGKAS